MGGVTCGVDFRLRYGSSSRELKTTSWTAENLVTNLVTNAGQPRPDLTLCCRSTRCLQGAVK